LRALPVAAVTVLLGLTAGCGGAKQVDSSALEKQVSTQLTKSVGQKPDSVDCPKALEATKGATTRCSLTAGGSTYGLTVRTTKVDGDQVSFSVKVDDEPES